MGSLMDQTTAQSIPFYGTFQDDDDDSQCKSAKPRLLTVSFSCCIIVQTWLVFGLTMGYTSPVLSDLEGNRNNSSAAPLDKIGYQDLFSVLSPVGGLVGTLIAGWMVDRYGRKLSIMMCSITYTIGWLLIILTSLTNGAIFRILIFCGRFIGGIGVGFASLCAPLYLAELSPSETRGFFGTLPHLIQTIGVFIAQVVGTYTTYYWLALIMLVVIGLFTLLAVTLKETPWIIVSEIVPLKVRGFGVGIVTCANWTFVIIITGLFRNYKDAVHSWGAFWSFGLVCFCGIIYVAVFIPETKGKSLEEIEFSYKRLV